MVTKKKSEKQIHTYLAIKINKYDVSIGASINYEVRDPRHYRVDARVYKFETRVEIQGVCKYPEYRVGGNYKIDLYGSALRDGDFTLTLADCIKRDERGEIFGKKIRGKQRRVYNPPDCIGMLQCQIREQRWTGWAWISPQTVTDMLILLPVHHPLYLEIQEIRQGRNYRIGSLSLKTRDPAEE